MARIAYVNGRYLAAAEATVNIDDRGYQFADGVYEVCELRGGRLIDEAGHWARLRRSLGEVRIAPPLGEAALRLVVREVVRRNRIRDGLVYVQVTRGVAPRGHAFPLRPTRPSLVITASRADPLTAVRAIQGIAVVTVPDTRWARVDIKTTGLLANVLAKQAAREAGANEAWFVDKDGFVSEGASSNAWIVSRGGELITAPTSAPILAGVTRAAALSVAAVLGLGFAERRFSVAEALAAAEAFVTSATSIATPVIRLDGKPVGSGRPGPVAAALRQAMLERSSVAEA